MKHAHTHLALLLIALLTLTLSSCTHDEDPDIVKLQVKIAVRVDSRPPRSITLFGGYIYLGEGHEDNWQITQEYYRLYTDYIKVKKDDIVQLGNTPFKTDSEFARSFMTVEYPWASGKVFDVQTEMKGNKVILVFN